MSDTWDAWTVSHLNVCVRRSGTHQYHITTTYAANTVTNPARRVSFVTPARLFWSIIAFQHITHTLAVLPPLSDTDGGEQRANTTFTIPTHGFAHSFLNHATHPERTQSITSIHESRIARTIYYRHRKPLSYNNYSSPRNHGYQCYQFPETDREIMATSLTNSPKRLCKANKSSL